MILYHYTSALHLPAIADSQFLKLTDSNIGGPEGKTPDEFPVGPHAGPDVVWLTDMDGQGTNADTLREALALNPPPLMAGSLPSNYKVAIRFTVDIPDGDALRWDRFATDHGIHPRWKRTLEKGYRKPNRWFLCPREIPRSEWTNISVRPGTEFPAVIAQNEKVMEMLGWEVDL